MRMLCALLASVLLASGVPLVAQPATSADIALSLRKLNETGTVLMIAAHPDDEIFGAGYLAQRVDQGNDLYMLCTTRGEGGEVGEPPVGPKSRLGEFREIEMRNAARAPWSSSSTVTNLHTRCPRFRPLLSYSPCPRCRPSASPIFRAPS